MDIFYLNNDILEIIGEYVKSRRVLFNKEKVFLELREKWKIYGCICSVSKPCDICKCKGICYSSCGPDLKFHPGRNLLNNYKGNFRKWHSLENENYLLKYYIAGMLLY